MTSQDMTAQQADEVIVSSIRKFDEAAAIYSEMAKMAPWLPEYQQMGCQAEALIASAKADKARYFQWTSANPITVEGKTAGA
jgi:hypothetical protein